MCGIIGGYNSYFDKKTPLILSHRGPDDIGHYVDDRLFLGHTRLSIQDPSAAGHQPLKSGDGNYVIVYNGEIYNVNELRDELVADENIIFHGRSDTEVLLNLYIKYGLDFLSRLNGIFAFAIWNKNSNELLVARDGLGIKPLYYTKEDNRFLFSSEIKALLLDPGVSRTINNKALLSHLVYLWSPSPDTMLSEVKKLEPGNSLLVRDGKIVKKWRFYNLPYIKKPVRISESDAIEKTRKLLSQAVHRQMISDVPVGAFLSGGIDSSAIVALAKCNTIEQRLQTFTIDTSALCEQKNTADSDLHYAQQVAKHLDVDLNVVQVLPEDFNNLENVIYHLDEPQADPAALNTMLISQLARNKGIKVLLSGAGGDDVFSGYRRHFALLQEKYWTWLPQPVRYLMSHVIQYLPTPNTTMRRVKKALQYADLDLERRLVSYFYWINPEIISDTLAPAIKFQLQDYDVGSPLVHTLSDLPAEVEPLNRMLYLEGKHFLADHNLNYTDKMGMAAGVEIRVPFLDTDLISFAASLPVHFKQRRSAGKWVLKKAMEGILPNEIINRPKTGFGLPMRFLIQNQLKEMIDEILSPISVRNRGLFDYEGLQRLRKLDEAGSVDASYIVFSMLCIEIWCRKFIDR